MSKFFLCEITETRKILEYRGTRKTVKYDDDILQSTFYILQFKVYSLLSAVDSPHFIVSKESTV